MPKQVGHGAFERLAGLLAVDYGRVDVLNEEGGGELAGDEFVGADSVEDEVMAIRERERDFGSWSLEKLEGGTGHDGGMLTGGAGSWQG